MATKIISNNPYSLSDYWQKLVTHSFLIKVLAKRELKVKYSRTLIGIGWVVLQPIIVVVIYTLFFNNLIRINTENIPYPLFVITGLVLWYLFTGIVGKCSSALIESGDLIQKVSFPRLIILIAKSIPVIIECFVLLILVLIVLLCTNHSLNIYAITAFFYFLLVITLSFSIGIICSIIVLKYRDLMHAIPFAINFGIWLTPVFYSTIIVSDSYKNLYRFANPLATAMEGMRAGLFQSKGISMGSWVLFLITLFCLFIAFFIFTKFEKRITEKL